MIKQVIEEIKKAEEHAAAEICGVKESAGLRIKQSEAAGEELILEVAKYAEKESVEIIAKRVAETDAEIKSMKKNAEKEIENIRTKASLKIEKAVEYLLKEMGI